MQLFVIWPNIGYCHFSHRLAFAAVVRQSEADAAAAIADSDAAAVVIAGTDA